MIFKRIKEVRKSLGFKNQRDFAQTLSISLKTYQNYENGKVNAIPHTFIQKLNIEYKVCIVWLVTGQGVMFTTSCPIVYYINNRDGNVAVNGTINVNCLEQQKTNEVYKIRGYINE
ncbi:hypothetical protein CRU92_00905 [Arcobacter sp. FW59]|uniref:helix-turn-helix domain-containing protein n=1 Tax=Arcobacter sp. CECT 9188 TaxID=2044505 RepID=UPI000E01C867|nr:helix-turn-helix transcriptional regulator [Arcobacter sp. CECT 9188]RBQ27611.1 hypothetical protein CRU88_02795 [Arcobacter sp. CECT 9188]RBQ32303.1 hypothetical protein CRU92_00905 [Arcobacter sp. FW59]